MDSDLLKMLDERLVFHRFAQIPIKRDNLYADFIEIDEPDEISRAWVEFSGKIVDDLLLAIKLTKSYYERIVDEIRRSPETATKEKLNQIKDLTGFWLDLSIMSYLYSTIERRGVLNHKGIGIYNRGYIDTKKSFDELIILAYQSGDDFFNLSSRIVLGESLYLARQKNQLDLLDIADRSSSEKYELLGDYNLKQALFLFTRVRSSLVNSSNTFWFNDPIASNSLSEHALTHINEMLDNWKNCSADLVERGNQFKQGNYAFAKSFAELSLAQHYKRLAIAALIKNNNIMASDYFNQAFQLTQGMTLLDIDIKIINELWGQAVTTQNLIYNQMSRLCIVANDYDKAIELMKEEKKDELKELVDKTEETLNNILQLGDLAYISSVAVAYEGIFSFIQDQLELETPMSKIIEFVEKRVKTLADRLHKASHQITTDWLRVLVKDKNNTDALLDIIEYLELPLMSLFLLPTGNDITPSATSELLAIKNVTRSIITDLNANKEFTINPVKEMLMRAKSFRLAQQAVDYLSSVPDEDTINLIKEILKPLQTDTMIRGLLAELQLRTAVLQYQFINHIAPILESSGLLHDNNEDNQTSPMDESKMVEFIKDLEILKISAETLMKLKKPIELIDGRPLNWDVIKNTMNYSNALIMILDVLKKSANAMKASDWDDRIDFWDQAKDAAFKASEIIGQAQTQEAGQLAAQVYQFAQVLANYENMSRNRNKVKDFPIRGALELVHTLVMTI